MILSDTHVADLCRRAGFFGDDLVTAIACAAAASGNRPNFDHRIDPGPVAHYKGLYGLDVIDWPEYATHELENPHVAVAVAHELVKSTDGWRWCPAYRSGAYATTLPRARVAHTIYATTEPHLDVDVSGPVLGALQQRRIDAMRRLRGVSGTQPLGR